VPEIVVVAGVVEEEGDVEGVDVVVEAAVVEDVVVEVDLL
jgi:hypothetical protein